MAGIALIGAGIFAREEHLPALNRLDADIKAVYSRSKSSAAAFLTDARQFGYSLDLYSDETPGRTLEDLLQRNDIHAVIVALPIPIQPNICRKALVAGKHVLCEKPIAQDVKNAKDLVSEYQRDYLPRGLVFSVAEQFRYLDVLVLARKWVVEEKLIGDLTQVHLRLWRNLQPDGNKYLRKCWRKSPEHQGGFVLDGGVHHVALLRFVSGQEIIETRGFACQISGHMPPCDTVHAALLFSGGAVGTFSMSFASAKETQEVSFIGTKGSVAVSIPESKVSLMNAGQEVVKEEVAESNGVDNEIAAFLTAVGTGENESRAGVIEAFSDVAVIESLVVEDGMVQVWQS